MLTEQNIEAELSYAWLHAVASKAGFSCEYRNRHLDGAGVDATITADGPPLATDSKLWYVPVDVQLKATRKELHETTTHFSFSLEIAHYNKLRMIEIGAPRILIVLRLPKNAEEWLQVTEESLIARRCAWWVSLYNASSIEDQESRTVYVPRKNIVSPNGLTELMTRFSRQEVISYEGQ